MTDEAAMYEAVNAIREGLVVGVPTETVYGLAVDPMNAAAVATLFDLKGRPAEKPFAVLVSSLEQARELAVLTDVATTLANEYWPGPLTLVLPRSGNTPDWLGEHDRGTVGIRMPDHEVALMLLDMAGPLVVTSANWTGDSPVVDHAAAAAIFGDAVAVYLEGEAGGGSSSTVIDASSDTAALVRPGPVPWD
ncbi:MAG: L-threonylcarbamoyladenylate synthase [Acidimicrobiia bacterium]|nr:L-threonylcarbamoyladenylate synthase [Acidimicrobiia bacterium]